MENLTFQEHVEDCRKNARVGMNARFVRDGVKIHEGMIVGVSSTFLKIFKQRPRNGDSSSGDVGVEESGWYPMSCKLGGCILV